MGSWPLLMPGVHGCRRVVVCIRATDFEYGRQIHPAPKKLASRYSSISYINTYGSTRGFLP